MLTPNSIRRGAVWAVAAALGAGTIGGPGCERAPSNSKAPESPLVNPLNSAALPPSPDLAGFAPGSTFETHREGTLYDASPGWSWEVAPRSTAEYHGQFRTIRLLFVEPGSSLKWRVDGQEQPESPGELVVPLVRAGGTTYRPVLFGTSGQRETPPVRASGPDFQIYFPPADWKVDRVGVESCNPAELAKIKQDTLEKAAALGVSIPPEVIPGEAYSFSLKTIDGQIIDSQRLAGKVVVIFEWATWCSTCHIAMKRTLFPMAEKHPEEIVLIAINHNVPQDGYSKALKEMEGFPANCYNVALQDLDPTGQLHKLWGPARGRVSQYPLPLFIVISPDGRAHEARGFNLDPEAKDPLRELVNSALGRE